MKGIIFFVVILAIVLPLYNVQNRNLYELNGLSHAYFVKFEDGKQVYEEQDLSKFNMVSVSQAEGVVLTFENSSVNKVLEELEAKLVKEEFIDDMQIYYGYTSMYCDFIYIEGKQANIQLVQRQNETIAGLPIILSGF